MHRGMLLDLALALTKPQLLKQDKALVKAYYRRAQAYEKLGSLDEALADFKSAASLSPTDTVGDTARSQPT